MAIKHQELSSSEFYNYFADMCKKFYNNYIREKSIDEILMRGMICLKVQGKKICSISMNKVDPFIKIQWIPKMKNVIILIRNIEIDYDEDNVFEFFADDDILVEENKIYLRSKKDKNVTLSVCTR